MQASVDRRGLRREAWRWYFSYLGKRRGPMVLAVVPSAIVALLSLPALWLLRYALDTVIPHGAVLDLFLAAGGILACRLLGSACTLFFARRSLPHIRGITAEMRCDLIERLQRLRWIDQGRIEIARANGRIVNETERVEVMTHSMLYSVIPMILPVIVYAVVLFHISPLLATIFLTLTPILRLAARSAAQRLRIKINIFQDVYERFNVGTLHALQMLPVARLQGTEEHQFAGHRRNVQDLGDAGTEMAFAGMTNGEANGLVTTIIAVVLLVAGGMAVMSNLLSPGELAAFVFGSAQINSAMSKLIGAVPTIMNGEEALIRLAEFRNTGREDDRKAADAPPLSDPIVLENLSFAFGDRIIFSGQSMRIEPGTVTALAAPNGAGKTTLLELIAGLHEPLSGRILLGEHDLTATDGRAWRRRIGFVPQHPSFFHGSIRDNICFGRAGVTEAELDRAVRLAALDPVLRRLPDGIDTYMGDRGQLLSGGERQRIAIARSLIHGPEVLIIDEPSNHLDTAGTASLIDRLFRAPERPTSLIATHDRQLLALCDRIYDLVDGEIRLRGTTTEDEPRAIGTA